MKRHPL